MTERLRRFILLSLAAVFTALGIVNWIRTAREMWRFYTNMPVWDAWDYLSHFARYQQFDLSVLWIQHNEHREVGTELLFAIDMLFFHEQQILPTLASILTYLGALLLFVVFALDETKDRLLTICAATSVAAFAGYKLCVVSLTIPFLTSWPQWEFFGIAALAFVATYKQSSGRLLLVAAIGCAVAATYSMSNGMLVWPLLICAGILLDYKRSELLAIGVSGFLSIALYFYKYNNLHTFDPANALHHPLYALGFLGSFLGMPFSASYSYVTPWKASIYGWLALAIFFVDLAGVIRLRRFTSPAVIVLGGYCLLALTSATLTAIGRMDIKDPHYIAARAGRYITEPILFWCALLLLTVWLLSRAGLGWAAFALILAFGVLSILVLPNSRPYYDWWVNCFQKGQWAAIGMENGVVDGDISDVLFPDRNYVQQFKHVLSDNRLAAFCDPEPSWIGKTASTLFRTGPDGSVHGEVTYVKGRNHDFEVQGWAEDSTTLIFVDDSGRIIGFGLRPRAGPAQRYTRDVPAQFAFTGFIRGQFGAQEFSTWALDRRHRQMTRLGQLEVPLPR